MKVGGQGGGMDWKMEEDDVDKSAANARRKRKK